MRERAQARHRRTGPHGGQPTHRPRAASSSTSRARPGGRSRKAAGEAFPRELRGSPHHPRPRGDVLQGTPDLRARDGRARRARSAPRAAGTADTLGSVPQAHPRRLPGERGGTAECREPQTSPCGGRRHDSGPHITPTRPTGRRAGGQAGRQAGTVRHAGAPGNQRPSPRWHSPGRHRRFLGTACPPEALAHQARRARLSAMGGGSTDAVTTAHALRTLSPRHPRARSAAFDQRGGV